MRDTFQKELINISKKNKNLMLLTADLGFGVFDEFEKKFPKKYLNVGVAEQNLIGVSTGLAMNGKIVIAYSIANFLTLRCLEQIRNDAVYHNLNINLVSFSIFAGDIVGQIFTMLILTVAAAEAAIGLAIIVIFYRNNGSIRVEDIHGMKG